MIAALLLAVLAGDPASIAVESDRKEYYLGEPVPVRIRVVLDTKFLAENAVPLTLRQTDVPVLVEVPWLKALPAGSGDATLAMNDDVVPACREVNGSGATVLVLHRKIRPEKAGDLELAAPVLRFASATRFDEDALGTRIALDRTERSVKGSPLLLRILPLPAEGRPPRFSGGIGKFSIMATADAKEVVAGKSLHLHLTILGEGNLGDLVPPRVEDLPGFHVYGRLLRMGGPGRFFDYEVSPLTEEVREIPSIALEYFDPTPPAGYRTARTAPIPLRVRPGLAAPASSPPAEKGGTPPGLLITVAVVLAAMVAAGIRLYLRRRRKFPPAAEG